MSGAQSSNLYLNVVQFFNTRVNQTSEAAKIFVFLHWCLICAVLFHKINKFKMQIIILTTGCL